MIPRTQKQIQQNKNASAYRQYKGIIALAVNLSHNPAISAVTADSLTFLAKYLGHSDAALRMHLGFKQVIKTEE